MSILVFDIETVPDTVTGSRLYGLDGLSDEDIARAMFTRQVQKTGGSDFLPPHLHRIVAISAMLELNGSTKVWSLGETDSPEAELITRFYDGIERYSPTLVSWNGNGFDLPVLHYRSLLHKVPARRYWEYGDEHREFRYNNYLNRFHWRHIDLMDVLAGFAPRASAPLDEVAVMLGFPGKMGMSGANVWETYLAGGIDKIRAYCERDALNTFLVYYQWEVVRGRVSAEKCEEVFDDIKASIRKNERAHLIEFLDAWEQAAPPASG